MQRRIILFAFLVLGSAFISGYAHAALDTDYLKIYLGLSDAERTEKAGDFKSALTEFQDCYAQLEAMRKATPDWEPVLVLGRIEDCRAKIAELEIKVRTGPPSPTSSLDENELKKSAVALEGSPSTNGTEAITLPPFQPLPLVQASTPSRADSLARHTASYPWKAQIITTVFWIGEDGTKSSGWDVDWAKHNGGADDHYEMSGYASSKHASTVNPFYIALPFNDLRHPNEAAKWLPANWARPTQNGKPVSACRGRWIEMKNRAGRVCFAQWEDVGPENTNDPSYIFGSERPTASAGLSISPAVGKYLGIEGTSILSWRFVDNGDVSPGMWLRYDEQAVLFRALHDADKSAAKPDSL